MAWAWGRDQVDCGGGVEDKAVEGKRVDDEQFADVFGMGLGEHERKKTAEGVSDYGCRLELVGDDVLVELLDDGREDGAGGVRAGGVSRKAGDLDEMQAMARGEQFCFGSVHVTGTGEARDEDDIGGLCPARRLR